MFKLRCIQVLVPEPWPLIKPMVNISYFCFFFSGMMSKEEHSVHNEWFGWITKRQQPKLDLISKIN